MSDTEEIDSTTDDSPELPDGLVSVVAAGFDALKWEFVDDNIFKISYGKHKKVTLRRDNADKKYDVPDGVTVKKSSKQVLAEITTFKGVHSIHQEDFSTSIKTSLGVDGISASTSFSLAKSSRIETDDQKTTTFKSCYVLVYIFTRNSTKKLSNGFKSDLKGLPTSYEPGNSGNKDKFIKLFQKWGTHYLSKGFFGGSFVVRLVMDARAFEKFSSSEIKTAVDTSYEGVVNSSTSVEVENKTIDSFKSEDRSTRIEVYGVGGTKSVQQYDDWIASVAARLCFWTTLWRFRRRRSRRSSRRSGSLPTTTTTRPAGRRHCSRPGKRICHRRSSRTTGFRGRSPDSSMSIFWRTRMGS